MLNQKNRLGFLFERNYMKQNKISYAHVVGLNIYIVYKLQKRIVSSPDFTVQNALFRNIKLTKNVDTSHYNYSGYETCFDSGSSFSFDNSITAKYVINCLLLKDQK